MPLRNILHRDNEHILLERSYNEENSFIANVNDLVNDLENIDLLAENLHIINSALETAEEIKIIYGNVKQLADDVKADKLHVDQKAEEVANDIATVKNYSNQVNAALGRILESEANARQSEIVAKEAVNLCLGYAKQAEDTYNKLEYSYEDLVKYAKLAEDKANEADHHAQDAAYNANLATDRATDALNSVAKAKLSEENAHRDSLLASVILRDVSDIKTELMKLVVSIADKERELREKADTFVNKLDFYHFIAEITHTNIQQSEKFYLLLQKLTDLELSHSEDIARINDTNLQQSIRISSLIEQQGLDDRTYWSFLTDSNTDIPITGKPIFDFEDDTDSGILYHLAGLGDVTFESD